MEKTFESRIESIPLIQTFIRKALAASGAGAKILFKIDLMVEEIVVNIVRHGSREGENTRISVLVDTPEDGIIIEISDCGPAFNPLIHKDPDTAASLDQRKPGGLGIFLVKQIAQKIHYQRRDGRNILRLHLEKG